DRVVILFHRARSRAAQDPESASARSWRRVAGAWGWFLSHQQICGGARILAGASDLVQVGELLDLALGRDAAGADLLCRRGYLSCRSQCARYSKLGRDPSVHRLDRIGLGAL